MDLIISQIEVPLVVKFKSKVHKSDEIKFSNYRDYLFVFKRVL